MFLCNHACELTIVSKDIQAVKKFKALEERKKDTKTK